MSVINPSRKEILSFLFSDQFLIENNKQTSDKDEKFSLSNIFYSLSEQNSFSATVFFDLKKLFSKRLYFANLFNYSDFNKYFRDNFIVSINAYLEKDENILPLTFRYEKDSVFLANNKQSDFLVLTSTNNIDSIKFNNSKLKIKFNYNESSIEYVKNIILPFLDSMSLKISEEKEMVIDNDIVKLLIFYKIIKETNSNSISIINLAESMLSIQGNIIDKENIGVLNNLISITKQKYVSLLRDIKTEYLANTILEIDYEEKIDLQYTNARVSFIDTISSDSIITTYKSKAFNESFSGEITNYFDSISPTIDNTLIDYNSIPISFSTKKIRIGTQNIYNNSINFNNYVTSPIEEAVLDKASYDFIKSLTYFSSEKNEESIRISSPKDLLDDNLFYNNLISIQQTTNTTQTNESNSIKKMFNTFKRDDPRSYKKFPTYLSDNACLSASSESQLPKSISEKNRESSRQIPENLFNNLSCNNAFVDSNYYSNKYLRVSSSLQNLPVQVLYPYTQFKNKTNTLFEDKEPVVANSKLFSIFYTNFKLIAKVEYLEGLSDGMFSFWKILTPTIINQAAPKKLLCRLSFYYNSDVGIKEQTFDQFSIYNKYFYIEA